MTDILDLAAGPIVRAGRFIVLVKERRKRAQAARSWLGALAAMALFVVALAAPMSAAAQGGTKLSNAIVAPRSGTTATTIAITVVYRNGNGSRADTVTARIGEIDKAMSSETGGNWGAGVTFRWSGTLPAGTRAVVLTAQSKDKSRASLAAGTVTISAVPAPPPKPTPKPMPEPTPKATPRPTPRPTPKPTPATIPTATPAPTRQPTAAPTAAPTTAPTAGGFTDPSAAPIPLDTATPEPTPAATPAPTDPLVTAAAGTTPGGSDGTTHGGSNGATGPGRSGPDKNLGGGWGPIASLLATAGLKGPTLPGLALVPTLLTTTGAVAAAMAFGLFGRKRREDDDLERDRALAAAAASGVAVVPLALAGATVADVNAAGARPTDTDAEALADPDHMESLMPRWRRPSLIQARKADPIRDNVAAARLTFDRGLVGPLDGHERRVVRFRVVRLLDSPDELRGAELGYLDRGDEVQLLEKHGAYWLVLAPDGQQGWLHKMTLGDIVDQAGAPESDGPVATMPIVADSWTMGESDGDGDAFGAYLESRRREG